MSCKNEQEVEQWPFLINEGNDKQGPWKENATKYPGIWAGLDLGTTHSSLAVWDTQLHRPKLLRLDIAPFMGRKRGKLVPSSVLFLVEDQQRQLFPISPLVDVESVVPTAHRKIKAMVGIDACNFRDQCYTNMYNPGNTKGSNKYRDHISTMRAQSSTSFNGSEIEKEQDVINPSHVEAAFISSSKRMFGKSLSTCSQDFISQLPYSTVGDVTDDKEAQIQIHPLSYNPPINEHYYSPQNHDYTHPKSPLCIKPSQISSIMMKALREAAQRSLDANHKTFTSNPPVATMEGSSSSIGNPSYHLRNVIIGVPAHFTLYQRQLVERSAREAGFDGYVGTITESTAAALAYGLLTSSSFHNHAAALSTDTTTTTNEQNEMVKNQVYDNGKHKYSNVLVFDMGGGTTDVTIVQLVKKRSAYSEDEKIATGEENFQSANYRELKETVECRVIATSGDVALGGDDIDELLTQWFLSHDGTPTDASKTITEAMNNIEHRELRRACCRAKEDLCGDGKDQGFQKFVFIEHGTKRVKLSMEMFEHIIEQVVRRAEETINLALLSFLEHIKSKGKEENVSRDDSEKISVIDEVVLVGGGSRIPAIRKMLRKKFPPPNPPELCSALNACSLVAMGTATHAAMISGQVPLYEIISALTLDSLPHTIGILTVDNAKNTSARCDLKRLHQFEHRFFPILMKDSPLPSSNYKTFELADSHQKGITVHVVEYVGGRIGLHEYEHVGEFTFLLHKLSSTNRHEALNANIKRTVDVAISVDRDGNLNVSIFDWNDPEHVMKLRRYLSQKEEDGDIDELVYQQLVGNRGGGITQEQMLLIIGCFMLIALYVFVKLLFSSEGTRSPNEL